MKRKSNKKQSILSSATQVEVVMQKQMTLYDFERMKKQARNKGWLVKVYDLGVFGKRVV